MKRPGDRAAAPVQDPRLFGPLAGLLELTASERPGLLDVLIWALEDGPVRLTLRGLLADWEIEVKDLPVVAVRTARELQRLEGRKRLVLDSPYFARQRHLSMLAGFAAARCARVFAPPSRRSRLARVHRGLEAGLEEARERRRIEALIGIASDPAPAASDPQWLEDFIGRTKE